MRNRISPHNYDALLTNENKQSDGKKATAKKSEKSNNPWVLLRCLLCDLSILMLLENDQEESTVASWAGHVFMYALET